MMDRLPASNHLSALRLLPLIPPPRYVASFMTWLYCIDPYTITKTPDLSVEQFLELMSPSQLAESCNTAIPPAETPTTPAPRASQVCSNPLLSVLTFGSHCL